MFYIKLCLIKCLELNRNLKWHLSCVHIPLLQELLSHCLHHSVVCILQWFFFSLSSCLSLVCYCFMAVGVVCLFATSDITFTRNCKNEQEKNTHSPTHSYSTIFRHTFVSNHSALANAFGLCHWADNVFYCFFSVGLFADSFVSCLHHIDFQILT